MGEVALMHDLDIGRRVAVKRLLPDARSDAAILRFADEVRVVGRLEHPAIVPIYDVGIDDDGMHYAVMKYVEGDTLESIIEKLKAGDPATVERFSQEYRVQIFLTIVQAVRYAHDQGIIHRDLKPTNIMIGGHGEVQVIDWGIAKEITRSEGNDSKLRKALSATLPADSERLIKTNDGALLGTPLYMSPEQARGETDSLDEQSDVFSLCLLFLELMSLHHPLSDKKSVHEVVHTLGNVPFTTAKLRPFALKHGTPIQYAYVACKGLAFDRSERIPSLADLERKLLDVQRGAIGVVCHVTLTKRLSSAFVHWIDRHPLLYTILFACFVLSALAGFVSLVLRLVHAL